MDKRQEKVKDILIALLNDPYQAIEVLLAMIGDLEAKSEWLALELERRSDTPAHVWNGIAVAEVERTKNESKQN